MKIKKLSIILLLISFVGNIAAQSIKLSTTQSIYLNLGTKSSCSASGVINDPTDPVANDGIMFEVTGTGTFTATSSKTKIVAASGLTVETITANQKYCLKIKAIAEGYSDITASYGGKTFKITYAASTGGAKDTYWMSGMSDASAAVVINDYWVVADDETNGLRVYNRDHSGMPVKTFEFDSNLKVSGEMDTEAASQGQKYPDYYYFVASMGQSKKGEDRPEHNRIWAVQNKAVSGIPNLSFAAYTDKVRPVLVSWIKSNYGNSAVDEKIAPKNENGFNIEGFAIAKDYRGYIGFRAPLITDGGKKKALIATIPEFEDALLSKNGKSMSNIASYLEAPILLNLDNRGIRSMEQMSNGVFLIVAGGCGDEDVETSSRLYAWSGRVGEEPVLIKEYPVEKNKSTAELNPEAMVIRSFDEKTGVVSIDLIHDKGTADFYGDGKEAKDLKANEHKKFRVDMLSYQLSLPSGSKENHYTELSIYPNPVRDLLNISGISEDSLLEVYNLQGIRLLQGSGTSLDISSLIRGTYILKVEDQQRLFVKN